MAVIVEEDPRKGRATFFSRWFWLRAIPFCARMQARLQMFTTFYTSLRRNPASLRSEYQGHCLVKEFSMKKTLLAAAVAIVSLGGCIAVPVSDGYGYGYAPGYYAPPAASFSFGIHGRGHGYGRGGYGRGYGPRYRHWR